MIPADNDRWVVRIVVGGLALVGIVGVLGCLWLNGNGHTPDPTLLVIIGGAVSALAAILSRTASHPDPPAPQALVVAPFPPQPPDAPAPAPPAVDAAEAPEPAVARPLGTRRR